MSELPKNHFSAFQVRLARNLNLTLWQEKELEPVSLGIGAFMAAQEKTLKPQAKRLKPTPVEKAPSPLTATTQAKKPPQTITTAPTFNTPSTPQTSKTSKTTPPEEKHWFEHSAYPWQELESKALQCKACPLHQTRRQVVFGDGSLKAKVMLIGEGPGEKEDEQGLPFVGRSGQLLNNIFKSIGLSRGEVYIANIVKCRPPSNRNPEPEEAAACAHFLANQISLIKPQLIVALGRVPAQFLLQSSKPVSTLRGQIHKVKAINSSVLVTFHPAYLLRQPSQKAQVWQDLKLIKGYLS